MHAELGEIVTGRKPGRTRRDEIVVFDSTAVGVLDAVIAVHVHRRASAGAIACSLALGAR